MQNKGCITCKKCEQVRLNFYCGRKKLSQKQLYNKYGFCTRYEPVEQKPQTNEEWFSGMYTEAKAEWLADHMKCSKCPQQNRCNGYHGGCVALMLEWLKEKHDEM